MKFWRKWKSKSKKMDRLRRSLRESFRRRKEHIPECSKPHQWQTDEASVRAGTCNFTVKYLGCVEVFESRGMQVCEEALKVLRNSRRRTMKGTLYVTGDGLRVVDEETKGLIVDQTIEKVSFCAPDRTCEKGFSYICRDGTTRRWMCHGFLAIRDSVSGERLSHAVGCAFAVCLERKQKRDKESVMATFDTKSSTFTRTGSFRQAPLTERLQDPQECKPSVPPPVKEVHNPYAIERPHATANMLQRQGSFRGFNSLHQASPFKRQLSLRVNDLPSNMERQRSMSLESADLFAQKNGPTVAPIPESSPSLEKVDSISAMCQQLTEGLSLLSTNSDLANKPDSSQLQGKLGDPTKDIANSWLNSNPSALHQQVHAYASVPTQDFNAVQAALPQTVPFNQQPLPLAPPRKSSPNFTHLRSYSLSSNENFGMSNPVATSTSKNSFDWLQEAKGQEQSATTTQSLWSNGNSSYNSSQSSKVVEPDPFDVDWVSAPPRHQVSTNPFAQNAVKAFEVQM